MRELTRLRKISARARVLREARNPAAFYETAQYRDARLALDKEVGLLRHDIREDKWGYFYVASPYTAPDGPQRKATETRRYKRVRDFCADCFTLDIPVFSPIALWHPIAREHGLPTEASHFKTQNDHMLGRAQGLIVLQMPGWDESRGVARERRFAKEHYIPEFLAADAPTFDDPLELVRDLKKELYK